LGNSSAGCWYSLATLQEEIKTTRIKELIHGKLFFEDEQGTERTRVRRKERRKKFISPAPNFSAVIEYNFLFIFCVMFFVLIYEIYSAR
jgi:hypothetical protein